MSEPTQYHIPATPRSTTVITPYQALSWCLPRLRSDRCHVSCALRHMLYLHVGEAYRSSLSPSPTILLSPFNSSIPPLHYVSHSPHFRSSFRFIFQLPTYIR